MISKSFSIDISKEVLLNEFERQNELRLARLKAERDKAIERERAEQLDKYYAEIEAAIKKPSAPEKNMPKARKQGQMQPHQKRKSILAAPLSATNRITV